MPGTPTTAPTFESAVQERLRELAARPRLATAGEISEAIGQSKQVVYRLVREDRIPHVRLGRPVRFDAAAVARWVHAGGTANGDGTGEG